MTTQCRVWKALNDKVSLNKEHCGECVFIDGQICIITPMGGDTIRDNKRTQFCLECFEGKG